MNTPSLREQALSIWRSAVDEVRPARLLPRAFANGSSALESVNRAKRIIVVGGGKAGAAMSAALEDALSDHLDKIEGIVNVPADSARELRKIKLHPARPAGSNHPTVEGVEGAERMLELVAHAGPDDMAICLLSGGGSALLPAPAPGITLGDKQAVTKLLHACGASINEMNAVRKHLSRIKGGRLAQAFTGRAMLGLIISDVVGDPLDVIASGPTTADPTTFRDALSILQRYGLTSQVPVNVLNHLRRGVEGAIPETLKQSGVCENMMLGNNGVALAAARRTAERLGFRVLNLGSYIEGETRPVAIAVAGMVRGIRNDGQPIAVPACVLSGGETTVTLHGGSGKGGRNQEFVLAMLNKLGPDGMRGVAVLSGGTDGEDGPTDAAGGVVDERTFVEIHGHGLDLERALAEHDAYPLLERCGGLIRTGLTDTNVMDVRVILIT